MFVLVEGVPFTARRVMMRMNVISRRVPMTMSKRDFAFVEYLNEVLGLVILTGWVK